ncbi:MAG: cytochrome c family protein [Acidobacteriota bacterium]|nr:cytochrome c family protein [Acidobacteriota bacterium]MDH3785303.1 cytochrome c family protein [Acidobacteriota bacterium]
MNRSVLKSSLLLVPVGLLICVPLLAEEHAYVGTKNCRKCHMKEWKSWAETKMAKTFETLKPGVLAEAKSAAGLDPDKDYTTDPECLPCHTTGYGEEGGFVDVESSPELLGVGCEMCHGPGGTYTKEEHMSLKNKEYKKADVVAVGMVDKITVEQCQGCHNTDSPFVGDDYVFDFDARKEEGTHEKFPLRYPH